MSWFSLIQAEKNVLDSQSFFESALTGKCIGKYAVKHGLNKSQTYVKIREGIATFFTSKVSHRLNPLCDTISDKLLFKVQQENHSGLFQEITKTVIIFSLEPFCKKVVKNGLRIFVQKQIEKNFDSIWGKGISLAAITGLYHIALSALKCPVLNRNSLLQHSIDSVTPYLPSPTTLMSVLTAFHVAKMIHIFWKTDFDEEDSDKEEVKQLIVEQTKQPIKAALEEKPTYKVLHHFLKEEKMDALISFLVKELIDHCYWENLHQTRIFNIPLVI
jgi:hypothetical protein